VEPLTAYSSSHTGRRAAGADPRDGGAAGTPRPRRHPHRRAHPARRRRGERTVPPAAPVDPPEEPVNLAGKVPTAKKLAPTRPHPAALNAEPFHKLAGPGVGLVDRLRDRLSGRTTSGGAGTTLSARSTPSGIPIARNAPPPSSQRTATFTTTPRARDVKTPDEYDVPGRTDGRRRLGPKPGEPKRNTPPSARRRSARRSWGSSSIPASPPSPSSTGKHSPR
jgi:hypothetical protein